MNQSPRPAPIVILAILLLTGAGAIAVAFWILDHDLALPNAGFIIALLFGVFFISYTWALFKFLRWRDSKRVALTRSGLQPRPNLEGTVYGLMPGRAYRVMKSFTDYYGNSFQRHEVLHFKQRHFLPYEGGHTIIFEERSLYLQEDQSREILENFSEYITEVSR